MVVTVDRLGRSRRFSTQSKRRSRREHEFSRAPSSLSVSRGLNQLTASEPLGPMGGLEAVSTESSIYEHKWGKASVSPDTKARSDEETDWTDEDWTDEEVPYVSSDKAHKRAVELCGEKALRRSDSGAFAVWMLEKINREQGGILDKVNAAVARGLVGPEKALMESLNFLVISQKRGERVTPEEVAEVILFGPSEPLDKELCSMTAHSVDKLRSMGQPDPQGRLEKYLETDEGKGWMFLFIHKITQQYVELKGRQQRAPTATKEKFINALKATWPAALFAGALGGTVLGLTAWFFTITPQILAMVLLGSGFFVGGHMLKSYGSQHDQSK